MFLLCFHVVHVECLLSFSRVPYSGSTNFPASIQSVLPSKKHVQATVAKNFIDLLLSEIWANFPKVCSPAVSCSPLRSFHLTGKCWAVSVILTKDSALSYFENSRLTALSRQKPFSESGLEKCA